MRKKIFLWQLYFYYLFLYIFIFMLTIKRRQKSDIFNIE